MNELTESHGLKVLLADDEWLVCWSLERHLVRLGLTVESAGTGAEALDKLEHSGADWLITDLKMPGMDGFELIEKARRIQPALKAMVMTAFGSAAVEERARKLGAVYMSKPFDLEKIAAVLLKSSQPN